MVSRIGGNLSDMRGTAGVMDETGAAADESGARASGFAEELAVEVDDVTALLNRHFHEMAEHLRQQIRAARQRLQTTDWDGAARQRADATEAELNGQVQRVLEAALEQVEQLRQRLLSQTTDFQGSVDSRFRGVMGQVNQRYAALSQGTARMAEGLESVDSSVRFG